MEGESGWQMRHTYNACMKQLENYHSQVVTEWQSNITAELTMKLKQPLLVVLHNCLFLTNMYYHIIEQMKQDLPKKRLSVAL